MIRYRIERRYDRDDFVAPVRLTLEADSEEAIGRALRAIAEALEGQDVTYRHGALGIVRDDQAEHWRGLARSIR